MPARLGELLVRCALITRAQLRRAQDAQQREGGTLGWHLVRLGVVTEARLTELLAQCYGVPAVHLADVAIDHAALSLVARELCEKHCLLPIRRAGPSLVVAMSDPTNIFAIDDIKFLTRFHIEVVVAADVSIRAAIAKHYPSPFDAVASVDEGMAGVTQDRAHAERFVRALVQRGVVTDATLGSAKSRCRTYGGDVGEHLVALGVARARLEEVAAATSPRSLARATVDNAVRRGANAVSVRRMPTGAQVWLRLDGDWKPVADCPAGLVDDLVAELRARAQPCVTEDGTFGTDVEVVWLARLRERAPLLLHAHDVVRTLQIVGGQARLEPSATEVEVRARDGVLFRYPAAAHAEVCARVHGKRLQEPGPFGPRVVVVA